MGDNIVIEGLDKVALLRKLWDRMHFAQFFNLFPGTKKPTFDEEEAKLVVNGYIDYFCGKCIKSDISGNVVNVRLYDREAGSYAFRCIVNEMNEEKTKNM